MKEDLVLRGVDVEEMAVFVDRVISLDEFLVWDGNV